MKVLWAVMAVLIILLQARLWVGEGSYAHAWQLQDKIDTQQAENRRLAHRNEKLYAEVRNLRHGDGAIEGRARTELGLIGEDETFFLVVEP